VVHAATVHPNGKDYVLAPFVDPSFGYDDENEDDGEDRFCIRLEVFPQGERKCEPVMVEGADGESDHQLYTSTLHGLVFVFFRGFRADSDWTLAAYRDCGSRFEQVYRVDLPERMTLFSDEQRQRVFVLNCRSAKPQVLELGEAAPVFSSLPLAPIGRPFPGFGGRPGVCMSRGRNDEPFQKSLSFIRTASPGELYKAIQMMKSPGGDLPEAIDTFQRALEASSHIEEAKKLKAWLKEAHPTYVAFRLAEAETAGKEGNWDKVLQLLGGIPNEELICSNHRHLGHLLGIAQFRKGAIEQALNTWEDAATFDDADCRLDPYISYARGILGKPGEMNARLKAALDLFAAVDEAFSRERWAEAINLIRDCHALDVEDLQMQARLVAALLALEPQQGSPSWVFRIVGLGHFVESLKDYFPPEEIILPPNFETYSKERVQDLADRAQQWLDAIGTKAG